MYHCTRSIAGRTVLVIDDVMTTGSTLNAVATALRQAGAVSVNGLVLARTPARHAP
jgi:predicted amidophosphoribosyltransferase